MLGSCQRTQQIALGAIILASAGTALFRREQVVAAREELVAFARDVQLGESSADVASRCRATSPLIRCETREGTVVAVSPGEIGSTNWLVSVPHVDGRVVGVAFGSSGGASL